MIFSTVDLKTQKKSFNKLQLAQHPIAVYMIPGYFFNYTGPFDMESLYNVVIGETFRKSSAYSSPKPLQPIDYAKLLMSQILEKKFYIMTIFGVISIASSVLILAAYNSFCKKKPEIKED